MAKEAIENEQAVAAVGADAPTELSNSEPSNSQRFMDNIKAKYPDIKDDEERYGKLMEDYDTEHEWAKKQRHSNDELGKLLKSDPEFGDFLEGVVNGENPSVALRHIEGWDADLTPEEQADRAEILEAEQKRYSNAIETKQKEMDNLEQSEQVLREYIEQENLTPDEAEDMLTFVQNEVIQPISEGTITVEMLELIDKGRRYDEDIEVARQAGRATGRNEQIMEKRQRFDHSLDNLPNGGTSGQELEELQSEMQGNPTLDMVRGITKRQQENNFF